MREYEHSPPVVLIVEEIQNFIQNLKSKTAENILLLSMSGRNRGIRLAYSSPRLNNVNAEMRFLSGQRYLGSAWEVNVLAKIRGLYGKETAELVKLLKTGEFLYHKPPEKPYVLRVPLFPDTYRTVKQTRNTYEPITDTQLANQLYSISMNFSRLIGILTAITLLYFLLH
jgi:hypothetical protein